MSKVSVKSIKCSNCDNVLNVNIYDSINVHLNRELKNKLLNGELTHVTCGCGQVIELRYPILYHKMGIGNSIMIQFTQLDIEEAKKQHELAKQFLQNTFSKSFFQSPLRGISSEEDIFEVYNDWDKFIERIIEIG